jgi:CheY-like chemotaxis protein
MAVIGSIELVRKRVPNDPKILGLLDNALQGAQRGATLTKRMLAFARRQDLEAEAIDIPVLVRGMTELLQRSLGPTIVIDTHFPLTLAPVQADANQLEMALLNLAVNARDAMPQGGEIVISAREKVLSRADGSLRPGRYICLSLKDTGEGMDEATLARASEPFFTTKGPGKGTGLGLAMVHGLAEQLGGRFYLVSDLGRGTTAELLLPVAEQAVAESDKASELIEQAHADTRPLAVLAVDDDNLVLMNTVAMLEDLGHTVVEANNGKQALSILHSGTQVDLVITDQAMPHMTGTQLAEAIRFEWPAMPIMLATGYAELPPHAGREFPKLSKPFLLADLEKALAETIESRKNILSFQSGRKKL